MNESAMLLRYWIELRRRLLNCLLVLAGIFMVLFYFANDLYTLLALPLLKHLPPGQGLIATNMMSPFFVPFELTFVVSLFIAVPIFLHQLWGFIAPALYQHERRMVWPLLLVSTLLFYSGVAFAYWVIFPILFGFLAHTAPLGVRVSPDIAEYLDFVLKLFFVFGTLFEVPVVTVLCVWMGMVTREQLITWRPYAIVAAFIVGMLLAPPDVMSQVLLAIPLWLLYEIGIIFSRFFVPMKQIKIV